MKRTEPKLLVDIIREAMNRDGIENSVDENRAAYLWAEVVGPGVNRYTTRRYVEKGIMHVYITSAVLKNELSFNRRSLVEAINRAVGRNIITDIRFH